MYAMYAEYAAVIDSVLVTALALVVWGAYRELRNRKSAAAQADSSLSGSIS